MPLAHQAVQLGDRTLVARVADVPHLDTALAARVHVSRGVADSDRAHHLSVVERVDLAGMAGDSRSDEGVWGEGDRLHLAIRSDVEGVGSVGMGPKREERQHRLW